VSGSTKFAKGLAVVLEGVTNLVMALDVHKNQVTSSLSDLYPHMELQRVCYLEVGGVTAAWNWIGVSCMTHQLAGDNQGALLLIYWRHPNTYIEVGIRRWSSGGEARGSSSKPK
jgi:hypothetical protein